MKKSILIALSLFLLLSLFSGCAAETAKNDAYYEYDIPKDEGFVAEDYLMADTEYSREENYATSTAPEVPESGSSVAANRKLIRRVSLTVETEAYDDLLNKVEQMIAAAGGYIESMDAYTRYSSTSRNASITIRIPVDRLDAFTRDMGEVSNVINRSESTQDVTLTYVDMQSRKEALTIEQERLMVLLEKADTLADLLEIESRLTEVRYQLESIESQLRTYDNLVDYATVSLSISEVEVLTDIAEKGFWEKIGDGFLNSLSGLWGALKSLFSFLLIASPYLFIFLIVPLVILLIFLKRRKKNR